MAEQPQAPILINPIPAININEGDTLSPIDLKEYVRSPNEVSGNLRFNALLADGRTLPAGLDCSEVGVVSGTVNAGTAGEYNVTFTIENDSDMPLIVWVKLTISPALTIEAVELPIEPPNYPEEQPSGESTLIPDLKSQVWKALGDNGPVPEIEHLLTRPLSPVELYYLLERYSVLTIWDVYNLEMPSEKTLLNLAGNSPHYNIYDRGSCLVAAPKDLYSHKRTLADALQAARIMANEVYRRDWTIEFAGFSKMARAAWIELRHLGDKYGKNIEILHYTPSPDDLKIYTAQSKIQGPSIT